MVNGAVALFEEALAESEGEVVEDFCFAVAEKVPVVVGFREEAGRVFWGHGKKGDGAYWANRPHRAYMAAV